MSTTCRHLREESNKPKPYVLVIGGTRFSLAVAEYVSEDAQSVTFVSENQPTDIGDGVKLIHHKLADANDVRTLASEVTDVDRFDMPQTLAEQIRGRYQ